MRGEYGIKAVPASTDRVQVQRLPIARVGQGADGSGHVKQLLTEVRHFAFGVGFVESDQVVQRMCADIGAKRPTIGVPAAGQWPDQG